MMRPVVKILKGTAAVKERNGWGEGDLRTDRGADPVADPDREADRVAKADREAERHACKCKLHVKLSFMRRANGSRSRGDFEVHRQTLGLTKKGGAEAPPFHILESGQAYGLVAVSLLGGCSIWPKALTFGGGQDDAAMAPAPAAPSGPRPRWR